MKKRTKTLLLLALLAVAMLALWGLYHATAPRADSAHKTITVDIEAPGLQRSLTIETDAAFLRGALEQEGLIAGEESAFGLYVKTVDGVTADEALQQWWCFTKNGGEELTTGVDQTPVEDGATYEITLRTGW